MRRKPPGRHYRYRELAGLLGLPEGTLRYWVSIGQLRAVKLGTAKTAPVLIPEEVVLDLLNRHEVPVRAGEAG